MNNVYVIEDNIALRSSLCLFLEDEGFLVEPFASAKEFLDRLTPDARGCVLADLVMPGMSGLQLLYEMQKLRCALPVIIITGETSVAMAVEVLKMPGVADFILKPFEAETMLAAVRAALADSGDPQEDEEVQSVREKLATLTPRQHDLLACLLRGLQNKSIAIELKISVRTVETHRAEVMSKMAAKSLPHLIRMALHAQSNHDMDA